METWAPPPRSAANPLPKSIATISRTSSLTGTILLGKYEVGRLLGRGNFAKVHQARSIADDDTVAIKIIDKTKTVDAAMEPRIIREVAAMKRLQDHPNVLKIHEVMASKTKIYLVMELASGGELFSKILKRGRLTEAGARRYFQQLASALHFCHQSGVTHRDMKPQNLLLDKDGNLKIADFGLSALPDQLNDGMLQTACGTPAYTAPEVFNRRGYDGAKSDSWSCGVVLFVLLAGFLPFDDANLVSMYKKINRRDYQFPPWMSKPARSIIYKLLDPNPNTRMSLEAVMATNWFKKSLNTNETILNNHHSIFQSLPDLKETKCNYEKINAFDIISLSSGLDLSGLFHTTKRTEKRFTSNVSVEAVVDRVNEVGQNLGYIVQRRKGGGSAIGLRKGSTVLVVEALEIATEVVVVELKVVEGEEIRLEELKEGIEDIVFSWHMDVCMNNTCS